MLFILILLLVVATIVSTAYLTEKGEALAVRTNYQKCHYDIVHENLPDLSDYHWLYDLLLGAFVAPYIFYYGTYDAGAVGSVWVWLVVCVFIFRCLTISVTIPTQTTHVKRDFGNWLKRHLTGTAHDLCFSGHVSFAFSLVLVGLHFGIISNRVLWFGLLACLGLFSAMSRSHFSIDIVMAVPIVMTFFDWTMCQSASKDTIFGGCDCAPDIITM